MEYTSPETFKLLSRMYYITVGIWVEYVTYEKACTRRLLAVRGPYPMCSFFCTATRQYPFIVHMIHTNPVCNHRNYIFCLCCRYPIPEVYLYEERYMTSCHLSCLHDHPQLNKTIKNCKRYVLVYPV